MGSFETFPSEGVGADATDSSMDERTWSEASHTPEALRRWAAKLVVFGFHGKQVDKHARKKIEQGCAGVILFARNVKDKEQVQELCAQLKRCAGNRPLLIAVDQEGGRIARLNKGFTQVPTARVLGSTERAEEAAAAAGQVLADELRAVHIDLDFAPVVDVDTNPNNPVIGDRSFGRDASKVAKAGASFIKAMQARGVAACAKHFPGHGDTDVDSHLELPRIPHTLERLEEVELPPFQAAVDAGVSTVMVAHVTVPAMQNQGENLPASMSPGAIKHLRETLGFKGVVVTDDLEMGAIEKHFTMQEAVVKGLEAGVDLFLVCHTEKLQDIAIEAIASAVESGRVPLQRVQESAARIENLMQLYVKPATQSESQGKLRIIGSKEHRERIMRILADAR